MFRSSSKPIPAAAVTASEIVTLFAGAAEPPGCARRGKFRMTPIQPLLIAAACTLALAACASAPPAYETSAPPPADTTGLGQNAATGGSTYGAANTGGTYPYGTIHRVEVVVMGPDGTVWVQSGAADARQQSDLDSCYFYAQGHALDLAALRGHISRRAPSLFNGCMVAKGYSRQ